MIKQILSSIFSVKTVIFFSCIATAILGIAVYNQVSTAKAFYTNLDDPNFLQSVAFLLLLCPIAILLTSLVGIFSLGKDEARKLFIMFLLVNMLICVIVLIKIPKETDTTAKFKKTLEEGQKLYDWTDNTQVFPPDKLTPQQRATRLWDNLQRMGNCCGLQQPFDWSPANQPDTKHFKEYPKSCCKQPELNNNGEYVCTKLGFIQYGCMRALADPLVIIMLEVGATLVLTFINSGLVLLIGR